MFSFLNKDKELFKSFKDIKNFNYKLNNFSYGIIDKNTLNSIYKVKYENFENNYFYHMNKELFEEKECGICWDYVFYQSLYFQYSKNIKELESYYIEFDDGKTNPTHTFNILKTKFKNEYIWFESSWKQEKGLSFNEDKNALLKQIISLLSLNVPNPKIIKGFYFGKYNTLDYRLKNNSCQEFMKNVKLFNTNITYYKSVGEIEGFIL